MWDQAIFAWLIGDEDKHGRNYSIQYLEGREPVLAPIYDAVCTMAYGHLSRGMSMRIGKAWQVKNVDRRALENEAGKWGLDPEKALGRVKWLAQVCTLAVSDMRKGGWSTGQPGRIVEGNARKVAAMDPAVRAVALGPVGPINM